MAEPTGETRDPIGQRLKAARLKSGYTQEAAAKAVGMSLSRLQAWEAGEDGGFRSLRELVALYRAKSPDVSVDEIFGFPPRELPAGKWLFDRELYDEIRRLPEKIDETAGSRLLDFDLPLVVLGTEIPPGATVLEKAEAEAMEREAFEKLKRIAPSSCETWQRRRRGR